MGKERQKAKSPSPWTAIRASLDRIHRRTEILRCLPLPVLPSREELDHRREHVEALLKARDDEDYFLGSIAWRAEFEAMLWSRETLRAAQFEGNHPWETRVAGWQRRVGLLESSLLEDYSDVSEIDDHEDLHLVERALQQVGVFRELRPSLIDLVGTLDAFRDYAVWEAPLDATRTVAIARSPHYQRFEILQTLVRSYEFQRLDSAISAYYEAAVQPTIHHWNVGMSVPKDAGFWLTIEELALLAGMRPESLKKRMCEDREDFELPYGQGSGRKKRLWNYFDLRPWLNGKWGELRNFPETEQGVREVLTELSNALRQGRSSS